MANWFFFFSPFLFEIWEFYQLKTHDLVWYIYLYSDMVRLNHVLGFITVELNTCLISWKNRLIQLGRKGNWLCVYWFNFFSECRYEDEMPRLYPHAKGILEALKEKGVDTALASRSPTPRIATTFLNKLGIRSWFVVQVSRWYNLFFLYPYVSFQSCFPINWEVMLVWWHC